MFNQTHLRLYKRAPRVHLVTESGADGGGVWGGRGTVLMSLSAVHFSHRLHEGLALALFRAPYTFFLANPAARILNRFARVRPTPSSPFPSNTQRACV
jgi:hypothetical protein